MTLTPQDLRDTVEAWQWLSAGQQPPVIGSPVTPRAAGFVAGVELQKYYNPSYLISPPRPSRTSKALVRTGRAGS